MGVCSSGPLVKETAAKPSRSAEPEQARGRQQAAQTVKKEGTEQEEPKEMDALREALQTITGDDEQVEEETPTTMEDIQTVPTLFHALSGRHWENAEKLIDDGVGLRFVKLNGWTVLHCALQRDAPLVIIQKILKRGIDPNSPDALLKNSPLHHAAINNASPEVVRALISAGAEVNRFAIAGASPLAFAADSNASVSLVETLLNAGADPNIPDYHGWTPLHWAVRKNADVKLVQVLLENGADPNFSDTTSQFSPIYYSLTPPVSTRIFCMLLRYGGRMDARLIEHITTHRPKYLPLFKHIQLMLTLCGPGSIPRLYRQSKTSLRMLPMDVLRSLQQMIPLSDEKNPDE